MLLFEYECVYMCIYRNNIVWYRYAISIHPSIYFLSKNIAGPYYLIHFSIYFISFYIFNIYLNFFFLIYFYII